MEMSTEIKDIAESLALAQAEIVSAEKDRINPHFKSSYATLASIWDACRGPLTKHGLSVAQDASAEGAMVTVTTMLLHKTGQWFKGSISMRAVNDTPQSIGSAITYGRRYALAAMAGVAPDDDDGNAGNGRDNQQQANGNSRPAPDQTALKMKKLRADLNKTLQGCKTSQAFKLACKAFQGEHGKIIWDTPTMHNEIETFGLMAKEHQTRLDSAEHFISPDGQAEWRVKLSKCTEKEFAQFEETMIAYPEYQNNQENHDAIAQRGRELGKEEYAVD